MKILDAFKDQGDVIWNIANLLRGPYKPPQYRRVMIPFTVLRRLDCVLEESKDDVIALHRHLKAETKIEDGKKVSKHDAETIEKIINQKLNLTFHNTSEFTFQKLLGDPDKLAANLRNFIAGFSSRARKIIDKFKFEEEIERLDEANRLFEIVKLIAAVDLRPQTPNHPDGIPNIAMGYVFEDLVRRFNEQANEEAGDHFTPREVIKLMVNLLFTYDDLVYNPDKVIKIYDPTAGTGGMLSESEKLIVDLETGLNPSAHLELFGQEYNPESYAICGSDLMIKGEDVKNIVFGDTLGTGKTKEGFTDGDGHPDEKFHYMLANPPFGVEWKPEKDYVTSEHEILEVLEGMKGAFAAGEIVTDRAIFGELLDDAFEDAGIKLEGKLRDTLLAPGGLGEKDPAAEICRNKKGLPEPDADLRDTENVPLPAGIALPLPLDYEEKKNKGKLNVEPLLALVRDHCEAYLAAEVLPYRPDAWIDHAKIKVGYEIPFNRHFYEYVPPRPLEEIEADIVGLEKEIMAMLKEVTA